MTEIPNIEAEKECTTDNHIVESSSEPADMSINGVRFVSRNDSGLF